MSNFANDMDDYLDDPIPSGPSPEEQIAKLREENAELLAILDAMSMGQRIVVEKADRLAEELGRFPSVGGTKLRDALQDYLKSRGK